MDDKQKDKGEFFFENHATRGVGVLVVCAAAAISFLRVSIIYDGIILVLILGII
jgi:hypothetical protein